MKKTTILPSLGDTRIKSKFLWFPKSIEHFDTLYDHFIRDTRWLCKASWEEEAVTERDVYGFPFLMWTSRKWVDFD